MRIVVRENCIGEYGAEESIEKLQFFGYEVIQLSDSDPIEGEPRFVIDRRHPEWRGWRSIMAAIEWRHRDKLVEWNRMQDGLVACKIVVEPDDEMCYT